MTTTDCGKYQNKPQAVVVSNKAGIPKIYAIVLLIRTSGYVVYNYETHG